MHRLAGLVTTLSVALLAGAISGAVHASPSAAAEAVQSLEYRVEAPDGSLVQLQFEILATNDADARASALRAVQELVPGGIATDLHPRAQDGGVSAAFASWPWLWDAREIPVPVWYAPVGAPAGVTEQMVRDALAPWSQVPTSAFSYHYSGTTDASPGIADRLLDGKNTIGWRKLDCSSGCVLGVTSKVPEAHEVDIMLNSNPEAGLGDGISSTIDVTTVLLHESGHMAGLEHSCASLGAGCTDRERSAVMYFRYQGIKRTLDVDDIAGISTLYPGSKPLTTVPALSLSAAAGLNLSQQLRSGWNLVVLPAGPIELVIGQFPCVEAVYSADGAAWQSWVRGDAGSTTLTAADGAHAYWLAAAAGCSTLNP